MKTRFLSILSVCAAALSLGVAQSHAAVLVGYNFEAADTNSNSTSDTYSVSTAPPANVTATPISEGVGAIATSRVVPSGGDGELNLSTNGSTSTTTEAGAVSGERYVEFALDTPSPSFRLDLDTLTLLLRQGGTSDSRFLFLPTSLDAFGSNIPVSPDNGASSTDGILLSTASDVSHTFTFPNTATYNSVPGAATFRLYVFSDGTGQRSVRIDNVIVNGSVIPEPSTFAMLLGGLGVLTMFRRRRA